MLFALLLSKRLFGAGESGEAGVWQSVLKTTLAWVVLSNLLAWFLVVRVLGRPASELVYAAATAAPLLFAPLVSWRLHSLTHALHQTHGAMRHMARVDGLTQLLNRHRFVESLGADLVRAARMGVPQAVLLLDLDLLKRVNDTHGHPVGDALLCSVADQLRSTLRPSDPIGRWSGKQFIIGLHGYSSQEAIAMAERVRAEIAVLRLPLESGLALYTSASVGVARWRGAGQSLDDLIKRADDAMCTAKQRGRDCVVGDVQFDGDSVAPSAPASLSGAGTIPPSGLDLVLAAAAAVQRSGAEGGASSQGAEKELAPADGASATAAPRVTESTSFIA